MAKAKNRRKPIFSELAGTIPEKLRPPFAIVLGAPHEVTELVRSLPAGPVTCYQMDLFPADRLGEELGTRGETSVETAGDLWDVSGPFQTVLYPVPYAGERQLKLDMIEQAFHVLAPHGTFIVMSPYDKDDFFPPALKKIFGKVHAPMAGNNQVFWCQRTKDRPRRRHEVTFQVQAGRPSPRPSPGVSGEEGSLPSSGVAGEGGSLRFVSRPGVFSYGSFDDGARALVETMEIMAGDRVLDLGCGCGTNGIFAARRAGPDGFVTFVDSNLRALALTRLNAENLGLTRFETLASATLAELSADSYDVVLANPPYFAQQGIARRFIERGRHALRTDGNLFLVTRQVEQIDEIMKEVFGAADVIERRGYYIFCTTK